jgi:hypothetical protein
VHHTDSRRPTFGHGGGCTLAAGGKQWQASYPGFLVVRYELLTK